MTQEAPKRRGRPPGAKNKVQREKPKSVRVARRKAEAKPSARRAAPPVVEVQAEIVLPGEGFGVRRDAPAPAALNGQWELVFPRRRGRPEGTTILKPDSATLDKIWDIGMIQGTMADVAVGLGVAQKTLQRFFDAHPSARDTYEDARVAGQGSLRAEIFKQALDGCVPVLIHASKHYLGLSDKPKDEGEGKNSISMDAIEAAANEFERRVLDLAAKRRAALSVPQDG